MMPIAMVAQGRARSAARVLTPLVRPRADGYARPMLAALITIPPNVGYAAVFGLIAIETMGIPVPGETALIAAALLAHDGQMDIVALVALAAAAAIIGDNVGFAIGRHGGRRLLLRP